MVTKGADRSSCFAGDGRMSCCKVESVVSVDDRGQMVLPKDVREKAGVHVGDKLAVVSWEKKGKVCCISLVKVEDMTAMVRDMLGPMMKEILQE
jgi:AbrB family looped-hinge helix DNA binding protein